MTTQVFRRRISPSTPMDQDMDRDRAAGWATEGEVVTHSNGGRRPWVWVCDVDGVINVSSPDPSWGTDRGSAVVKDETGYGYSFRWAWRLVEAIQRVAESGKVQIVWGTTWLIGDRVRELEKLWGLPRLARLWKPENVTRREDVGLVKVAQVAQIAMKYRLIWTDDREVPQAGTFRRDLINRGALLISPDPDRGLTRNDLEMIRSVIGMERWDD